MKLYTVRVEYETVVYAANEKEAEREAVYAIKWEDDEPSMVDAEELSPGDHLPEPWKDNYIPWGGGKNVDGKTIKQIWEES